MTNVLTSLTYPFASFKNNSCNTEILNRELSDAGITGANIVLSGTNAIISFISLLTLQQISTCDTVIANHNGSVFQPSMQGFFIPDDGSVDDGYTTSSEWTNCLVFDTGALPQSWYQIMWSAETSVDTGHTIEYRVLINGVTSIMSPVEVSYDSWDRSTWGNVSGGMWIYRRAGENASVQFQYKISGGKGYIRRRRFSLINVGMQVNS